MEKVKIPQFVADWIEEEGRKVYENRKDIFFTIPPVLFLPNYINEWITGTGEINVCDVMQRYSQLIRALEYDYEVEKEPLYYVRLIGYLNKTKDSDVFLSNIRFDNESHQTQFTEAEIKAIDERYWAFAVPVEEDE